jgi:methionyl-tRNA synthetase
MLSIEDFAKIELRVATVVAAAPHPNADKLMVLDVEIGGEPRRIVAGIRKHYAPEELVGKSIVVVANLQPAKLRGIESQGMLLAASDDDGRLALVIPEKPVGRGAKVR